jgi:Uma2 family endonuclease
VANEQRVFGAAGDGRVKKWLSLGRWAALCYLCCAKKISAMRKEDAYFDDDLEVLEWEEDYETERDKPVPSRNHGIIQSRLNVALGKRYLDRFELISEVKVAPPGVKPSVPDLCIYPKMVVDLLNDEIEMSEPPITAIEILSPTQGIEEVKDKIFDIFFPAGVQSAWLIVPTFHTVYIFTPDRQYTTFTSGTLHDPVTGIMLPLEEVFPRP